MNWTTYFDEENRILEVIFVGDSTLNDLIEAVRYSLDFSQKNGVNLYLADCRAYLTHDSNSIFNSYNLGKFYDEIVVDRNFREAIIIPSDRTTVDTLSFFETVVQNRGFSVRLFKDINMGREWLLDSTK